MAKLRRIVVGDDLEFLHRVDRQTRQLLRTRETDGVRGVAAVKDEVLVAGAAAGYGEYGIVLGRPGTAVDHDDARRERRERRRGTIWQRKRRKHFARDRLTDG